MASDDGRVQASYNGEIYNYREIREELRRKGHVFKTNSDTEVLIKSYEQWGIECLHKFIGNVCPGHLGREAKQAFPREGPRGNQTALLLQEKRAFPLRLGT